MILLWELGIIILMDCSGNAGRPGQLWKIKVCFSATFDDGLIFGVGCTRWALVDIIVHVDSQFFPAGPFLIQWVPSCSDVNYLEMHQIE